MAIQAAPLVRSVLETKAATFDAALEAAAWPTIMPTYQFVPEMQGFTQEALHRSSIDLVIGTPSKARCVDHGDFPETPTHQSLSVTF